MSNDHWHCRIFLCPLSTAPPPPPPSSGGECGVQYVYIWTSLIRLFSQDSGGGFLFNQGSQTAIRADAFFADPAATVRAVVFELTGQPEPPPALLVSVRNVTPGVAAAVAADPALAAAPVVPLWLSVIIKHRSGSSEVDGGNAEDRLVEAVRQRSLAEAAERVVPADESAAAALEEAAVSGGEYEGRDRCSICLEEFGGGDDDKIVRMPCAHFYHRKCVVEWLKRSHLCPLCRFAMPISSTASSG